jgi:hypothetical protein
MMDPAKGRDFLIWQVEGRKATGSQITDTDGEIGNGGEDAYGKTVAIRGGRPSG